MILRATLLLAVVALAGIARADETRFAEVVQKTTPVYLGSATMADDGSITVALKRSLTGNSDEGVVRYVSTDPSYEQVILHLSGLKPGETKPVLAWPPGS